jgi:hypothetical protein
MEIKKILESFGLELIKRNRWTAIYDRRTDFVRVFNKSKGRLGKIQDGQFYVTVGDLDGAARRLMESHALRIFELKTSDGERDTIYPGFNVDQCSSETFTDFMKDLQTIILEKLAKPG